MSCSFDGFRSLPERATFVAANVAKTIAPDMTVSATSCSLDFAAALADRVPARTRPSVACFGRAAAGDSPPFALWPAGFAALLPPCMLVHGSTRRFVGWAERSEAQRARVMTLGFSRTKSGRSPTCAGGER